jgi:type I restriction enzyme, S subunit
VTSAAGWREVKISQLGRVVTGKTPSSAKPELFGSDHPFITPTDIDGISRSVATDRFISVGGVAAFKNQVIPHGAVCFVCIGATIGKMCIANRLSLTNQQVNSIIVDETLHDSKFVFYALRNLAKDIKGLAGGAATPIISKSSFSDIAISVAPLEQQRRIGLLLSAYDDLIENNTRRIAILEEMARRLYEEWFVRFRFPGHEDVSMVESELGLVPEGWQANLLGDEIELPYGKALKAENRSAGEVPVYGSSGVVGCHSTSLVPGPGIIVGRKGNVGSVHWCDVPFFPIDTVFYVKTALPLHFVYFNLQQQNFLNNDAAVPGLNRNQAYALPLLVPDLDVLNRFEDLCGQLLGMARLLSRKNVNLRTTRDLLLPKLISGELDVSTLLEPLAETA